MHIVNMFRARNSSVVAILNEMA